MALQWQSWLAKEAKRLTGEEDAEANVVPEAEVIVLSASFLGGEVISRDSIGQTDFTNTIKLTNTVCSLLRVATSFKEKRLCDRHPWVTAEEDKFKHLKHRADEVMRELVLAVHEENRGVPSVVRRVCLNVRRSFYYAAHCSNEEMDDHVEMVLFQLVD